jgi:xylose isomerase
LQLWNNEIQALVAEINADDGSMSQYFGNDSAEKANASKAQSFDRSVIAGRGLKYEHLDQLSNRKGEDGRAVNEQ